MKTVFMALLAAFAATLGALAVSTFLCFVSGKTFIEAMGFPLSWQVVLWVLLPSFLSALLSLNRR